MKKINESEIFKLLFILLAITFAVPSIAFMIHNKTVLNFTGDLEFRFLLTKNVSRGLQAIVYFAIVALMVIVYYFIIKKRNVIFKNIKQILIFVSIITLVFVLVLPFSSSDVFYYMGIGRLSSQYHQNPYYESIKGYIDSNNVNLENDTLMRQSIYKFLV